MSSLPRLRSVLFVPGNRPELFPKAAAAGADALVLDLEDAVPASATELARAYVSAELARSPDRLTFVRFNHPAAGVLHEDLAVLAPHPAQAIMLPKVAGPADLEAIDKQLLWFEQEAHLESHAISVVVVVESAMGLRALYDTLRGTPRVRGAGLASAEQGDLILDIGGQWTPSGEALAYARGKFVCDARAARATWILDGVFMNIRDVAGLENEARSARAHGFTGKVAVHPRQVSAINAIFTPTAEEIERATQLLATFREAESRGQGAVQAQGMMIDRANVRWAERILWDAGASAVDLKGRKP